MTVRHERVSTRHGVLRAARPWAEGHGSAAVAGVQCSVSLGGSAVQLRRCWAGSRNTWIPVESPTLPPHVSARSAPHAGPPCPHPGGRTAAVRGRAPPNCHLRLSHELGLARRSEHRLRSRFFTAEVPGPLLRGCQAVCLSVHLSFPSLLRYK